MINYLKLLKNSYAVERKQGIGTIYEYLSAYIFGFTTYAQDMDKVFVVNAMEVCAAITDRKTFDYIKENHEKYLVMCNMPFFADKIEWGTSVRGAWWNYEITLSSCGLWDGERQLIETLKFTEDQWAEFLKAVIEIVRQNK